ncbi:Uma2 family endonuclease [Kitasatospora herbaricolor]|uniref:Uma2 family endonuclease n=1 Tax=Kitasatospora herbaricolor TaxID=68217 RepID=UPI00227D8190|nr:Uma2 family endonuclease [Kitasatospora herbaricolor]
MQTTDGKIIMAPQGISRWKVVLRAAPQIEAQLAGRGEILSDVAVDLPSVPGGLAPALAVVAPGAGPDRRGRYRGRDLEAVLDVVPRADQGDEFARTLRAHAECGIPLYVVVDPVEAVCTVHSDPQRTGAYREAERVPFGNDLYLPLADRTLVIETTGFPVEGARPGPTPGA